MNLSPVCAVDPGHGGNNPGAFSPSLYTREADLTLEVGLAASRIDSRLVMTRTTDQTISYRTRAAMMERCGAGLVVCLHYDFLRDNPRARGLRGYYYRGNGITRTLARYAVNNAPVELKGGRVLSHDESTKGVQYLCTIYPMNVLLIEFGFLSNPSDLRYVIRTDGIEACANLVVACCSKYRFIVSGEKDGQS